MESRLDKLHAVANEASRICFNTSVFCAAYPVVKEASRKAWLSYHLELNAQRVKNGQSPMSVIHFQTGGR